MFLKVISKSMLLWSLCIPYVHAEDIWHSRGMGRNFVFAIAGGPAWAGAGSTQTFYLKSDIENTYYNNRTQTDTLGVAEIFIGTYKELSDTLQAQFGLEIGWSGNVTASGEIWQDANRDYNNFTYSYRVSQTRVAAKAKLVMEDFPVISTVQPFVAGSLGVGINNSNDYQATPVIYPAVPAPAFTNSTVYALAYTIGGGLQFPINPFFQFGLGYEFAGWGKSQLGTAPGQTLNSGIALNNINTSAVIASLTYTS